LPRSGHGSLLIYNDFEHMKFATANNVSIRTVLFILTYLLFVPVACAEDSNLLFIKNYSDLEKLRRNQHTERKAWLGVINSFAQLHESSKSSSSHGRALFLAGKASLELYRRTKNKADLSRALSFLRNFNKIRHPKRSARYGTTPPKRANGGIADTTKHNNWNNACTSAGPPPLSKHRGPIVDTSHADNRSHFARGYKGHVGPNMNFARYAPNPFWNPSMSDTGWGSIFLPQRKTVQKEVKKISPIQHLAPSRAKQTKKKPIVVIDPGHGGRDPGAISPDGKVTEKELTLRMAKVLRKRLEDIHPGISVFLTRTDDRYMSLQERTSMANSLKADLFISVHCNSAEDKSYKGIETYCLSPASSRKSLEVAARENGLPPEMMGDVEATLLDMIMTAKSCESVNLARIVHTNLIQNVATNVGHDEDRHIKEAPFYVLLGAKMPAILIECGFISNSEDRKRLRSTEFVHEMAGGIAAGTSAYLKALGDKT
jgi:N-acetylmuramoyl-L-alanine amidase